MLAAIAEAEPEIQEILQRCAAAMQATRAALYLSHDGQPYELITHFGFQISPRRQIAGSDIVVERLIARKGGYCVNGQNADPKFYEILYHTGTDRILVMPVFASRQLVGFLDFRDKEGRQPFRTSDFAEAREGVDRLIDLFASRRLYGLDPSEAGTNIEPSDAAGLSKLIERSHHAVDRALQIYTPRGRTLNEAEIASASLVLPAILSLRGSVLAAFSTFGSSGNVQQIAARSTLSDAAAEAFEAKMKSWLKKQPEIEVSASTRIRTTYPFGESGAPIQPAQLVSILSAPVNVDPMRGLVLSVGFEIAPDHQTRQALETFLTLVRQTIQHSMSHLSMRTKRQKIAEKLLEPDFQKYPELLDHSRRVASLADQFARYLKLPPEEVELVRLAAFLHDVGMRFIDYKRIYTKKALNEDDLKLVREHPVIGAALILDSALGEEIANIVLCHHERPDGKGYPHGLVGEQIPLASRIVHLCEAFDAMTATESYQPPIPESAALVQISRAAAAQFDLDLARKFVEMLQNATAFGIES